MRAAAYIRQSVTRGKAEDSTSLAVQEDVIRRWVGDNGHALIGVYSDPDTSGSKVATADRPGWRALRAAEPEIIVVYAWDRLSRDEADSAITRGALGAAGIRLVSATEGEDQVSAGIHAVLAADFSRQHARRTRESRAKNLKDLKAVGGPQPYGYKVIGQDRNFRVAQDPERIQVVKAITERIRRGDSIHSIRMWLNAEGVPSPKGGAWNSWTAIRRIATHPYVFGARPFNEGAGGQTKVRGSGLLRGADGQVVIDESLAIMDRSAYEAMVSMLENNPRPQSTPRASRRSSSGLLSGYVYCACGGFDSDRKMYRANVNGRQGYACPRCHSAVSTGFEEVVVDAFHEVWDDVPRMHRVETADAGGADEAASLRDAIEHKAKQVAASDDVAGLVAEIQGLQARLAEAEARRPVLTWTWVPTGETYGQAWARAGEDEAARRRVLADALQRITVTKGRPGRRGPDAVRSRLLIDWAHDERDVA